MSIGGVTGLVLAGGLGRRMGGVDKGLQELQGRPLVAWVLERLQPQVESIVINANQNRDAYGRFGFPVIADCIGGFAGPLAGLHAGLTACTTPYLVSVPCDSPFLPSDLVIRLHAGLLATDAQLAVARTGAQLHPVFALCRVELLPSLSAFLDSGGRKIDAWFAALRTAEVAFDDEATGFANINTTNDLQQFSQGERTP